MAHNRKAIRIFLLVLIILGLGLLVTQAYWVMPLVNQILSHEPQPVLVPAAMSTPVTKVLATPIPNPGTKPPAPVSSTESGVDITATIGPTCPVQKDPPDPTCADRPYEATLVLATTIIGKNGGVLVKTDANGHFSENLEPGTYTIRAQSDAALPRLEPVTFTVEAHKRTAVHVQFDSGIR